jgi:hypothetical protein
VKQEYSAVLQLVKRSLPRNHEFKNCTRGFTSSAHHMQSNNKDPPDDQKKNKDDKNDNNDDKKISSMLAKAIMWMFTGYMLITIISLMFPGGNQPEIVRLVLCFSSFLFFSC